MQLDGFRRFLPYTGLICAVSLIAYMVIGGSTPTDTSSTAKFLDYYGPDNNSAGFFANFIFANLFAVFALFFVTEIRATLRSGEAGESIYSALAFAGGIAMAIAMSVAGMITVAAFSAGDKGYEAATLALGMLSAYSFLPWMISGAALFIAVGIGGLKTATLPKWIAWLSVVMGVLCFTPGGIAVFVIQPIWFVSMAVVLIRRQSAPASQKSVATGTPAVA
jgi:hypothetical protein